jgi:hypothetical protein
MDCQMLAQRALQASAVRDRSIRAAGARLEGIGTLRDRFDLVVLAWWESGRFAIGRTR